MYSCANNPLITQPGVFSCPVANSASSQISIHQIYKQHSDLKKKYPLKNFATGVYASASPASRGIFFNL
ncbi:hypothetical protein C4585_00040 [Candidatus Parcubacteria bacterium]|nr:MAG: hypothetical protein C4585_00040 [Candidatus Parcubacteria bacterium]